MGDDIAKIAIFQKKEVRKQLHNGEWWFVINDVVAVLAETTDPARYVRDLRYRNESIKELFENGDTQGASQISTPLDLKFDTAGGKQAFKCWNTEGIFRLVQSIPSKKAEPFKRWLARVGYERIQEIENPELAQKRMKMLYRLPFVLLDSSVRPHSHRGSTPSHGYQFAGCEEYHVNGVARNFPDFYVLL